MGRYFQNKYAPKKFVRPVMARAAGNPASAVRPEIKAGASALPPEVSNLNEAKNSLRDPSGARSAPNTMLIPADMALASAVTAARVQKVVRSVTKNANRYATPSIRRVGTEDQNLPYFSMMMPET